MKKYSRRVAGVLLVVLLLLLVVLSLGYVEVSPSVMYSLFIVILFILALLVMPKHFEKKRKR